VVVDDEVARFRRCRGARRRGGTGYSAGHGWLGAFCTFVISADPNRTVRFMGPWGTCPAISDRFPSPSSPAGPKRQPADHRTDICPQGGSFEVGDPLRNCRFLIIRPGMAHRAAGHDTHSRGDRPQSPPPKQTAAQAATARTGAPQRERERKHTPVSRRPATAADPTARRTGA
jgi:hypothetical protein